jgi:glutathione S-transferase
VPYEENNDVSSLSALLSDASPAHFAVPILEIRHTDGAGGESSYLSQTPAILSYLSSTLPAFSSSSSPSSSSASASALRHSTEAQLTLTALDLSNEAHDTHHPIASGLYYEEQRDEALRRAEDFRKNRVPKFLESFEKALQRGKGRLLAPEEEGKEGQKGAGVADLTLWQVSERRSESSTQSNVNGSIY